jgi:hypothetical protein
MNNSVTKKIRYNNMASFKDPPQELKVFEQKNLI